MKAFQALLSLFTAVFGFALLTVVFCHLVKERAYRQRLPPSNLTAQIIIGEDALKNIRFDEDQVFPGHGQSHEYSGASGHPHGDDYPPNDGCTIFHPADLLEMFRIWRSEENVPDDVAARLQEQMFARQHHFHQESDLFRWLDDAARHAAYYAQRQRRQCRPQQKRRY